MLSNENHVLELRQIESNLNSIGYVRDVFLQVDRGGLNQGAINAMQLG